MRLIDADALKEAYDASLLGYPGDIPPEATFEAIDAAPTVCCERCEYYEDAFCLHPDNMTYPLSGESGFNFVPEPDSVCSHFEERTV